MKRGTGESPKLHKLARLLGVRKAEARGLLEELLDWTYRQAIAGDVGKWDDEDIARGAGCECVDAASFVDALVESGWLDHHPVHRLVVHQLSEHADDTWKKQLGRKRLTFADLDGVRTLSGQSPDNVRIAIKDPPDNVRDAEPSRAEPSRVETPESLPLSEPATNGVRATPELLGVIWNEQFPERPVSSIGTGVRLEACEVALRDQPGVDYWRATFAELAAQIPQSEFLRGVSPTFDFACKHHLKIVERAYVDRKPVRRADSGSPMSPELKAQCDALQDEYDRYGVGPAADPVYRKMYNLPPIEPLPEGHWLQGRGCVPLAGRA